MQPEISNISCSPSYTPAAYSPSNVSGPLSQHEMQVYVVMAEQAEASGLYTGMNKSTILMKLLTARELGIPCMQAINGGIHLIEGKIEISARMITAMIRRAGHSIRIIENSNLICVLEGKRCDNGECAQVSYSIEDAKRAGLVRASGGWVRNPADMCYCRAASRLGRQLFSDVIWMGYVEGEIKERPLTPSQDLKIEPVEQTVYPGEVVAKFLDDQAAQDRGPWLQYIDTVSEKCGWNHLQTVDAFTKDMTSTQAKFLKWREKNGL